MVIQPYLFIKCYSDYRYKVIENTGVKEYWILNPDRKRIEVYQNRDSKFQLFQAIEGMGIVRSQLLEGFEVDIDKIF